MRASRPAFVKNKVFKAWLGVLIGDGDPAIVNVKRKNEAEHQGLMFIYSEVISQQRYRLGSHRATGLHVR